MVGGFSRPFPTVFNPRGACSRGYKRGERGREAPRSLLEEESIEAGANIGCSVVLNV